MAQHTALSSQDLLEIGIEKKQYPPFLYKYASVKSACRFLADHKCYFSSFDQFNDPYEGRYVIKSDYTLADWENHFHKSVGWPNPQAKSAAANMLKNPKFASESLKKDIQKVLDNTGVYCLSSENDNILLWSYYTQDHKGVCVEFSLREDTDFFMKHFLLPVKYDDNFPTIDFFRNAGSVIKAICHKAKCWEHEKEYRLIVPDQTRFVEEIKSKAITSLILGCKNGQCETQEEFDQFDALIEMLRQPHYSHMQIKQELLDETCFKVDIVDASFIARHYGNILKITALKDASFSIQEKNYNLKKWETKSIELRFNPILIEQSDNYTKIFTN